MKMVHNPDWKETRKEKWVGNVRNIINISINHNFRLKTANFRNKKL